MPGGNGTGPMGMGPMTGRAAGYCAGYATPGYMNPYGGRPAFGRGMGMGGGRGRRNWFYATGVPGYARAATGMPAFGGPSPYAPAAMPFGAPLSREQELDMLKSQTQHFETALQSIQQRITELETQEPGK